MKHEQSLKIISIFYKNAEEESYLRYYILHSWTDFDSVNAVK